MTLVRCNRVKQFAVGTKIGLFIAFIVIIIIIIIIIIVIIIIIMIIIIIIIVVVVVVVRPYLQFSVSHMPYFSSTKFPLINLTKATVLRVLIMFLTIIL